jgi:hypothetical protein
MDDSKQRRPRRTKAELAKQDAELERLIQEMHDPKTTAHKLGLSNSHVHLHYRLRGMRRGYITDAERIKIIAARKGVAL